MLRLKHVLRLTASLAVAGCITAPTALAQTAPGFEEFSGCPKSSEVGRCINATVTGGHLKLGSTDTPITDPIKLKGGVRNADGAFVFNRNGGLESPELRVPGGLIGLTGLDWLADLFPFQFLQVHAKAELAGTPTSPLLVPFRLPLKVRLISPLLSSHCMIGSDSSPIALTLTTRTTTPPPGFDPLTGTPPTLTPDPARPAIINATGGKFVDNTFAAPRAHDCTLLVPGIGLVDPIVNLRAGFPADPGVSVAEMPFSARVASARSVYPPTP